MKCLLILILSSCASAQSSVKKRYIPNRQTLSSSDKVKGELRILVVNKAHEYLGIRYQKDGKNPLMGFDCSGFVSYVFNQFGWSFRGGSKDLAQLGSYKNKEDVAEGDLVFFGEKIKGHTQITHVGIITSVSEGEITMIHSSSQIGISKENIRLSPYWNERVLFFKDVSHLI